MKTFTIKTIERQFPNQWLLIAVTETKDGAPLKGVVLKAGKRRQEVVEEIDRNKGKKTVFSLAKFPHHPIRLSHSNTVRNS
jgi:hypothetical protein